MQITHSAKDNCLLVTLTGKITLATAPQIQRALLKDLAEQPLAVICDLGGVDALVLSGHRVEVEVSEIRVECFEHSPRRWL